MVDMSVTREGHEYLYIRCFPFSNLSYRYSGPIIPSVLFSHRCHSLAMPDPIQKTTITRSVHIPAAVDGSHLEHNSAELTTIDPMSIVQFPPPTATQRASYYAMPAADPTLEYPCDLGLGPLHPARAEGGHREQVEHRTTCRLSNSHAELGRGNKG
jgi:hypothetical protein